MIFVVIGKDKAGGEPRRRHRAAHLEFIADHQAPLVYAGPLIDEGRMVGSLFVFDVEDRAQFRSGSSGSTTTGPGRSAVAVSHAVAVSTSRPSCVAVERAAAMLLPRRSRSTTKSISPNCSGFRNITDKLSATGNPVDAVIAVSARAAP